MEILLVILCIVAIIIAFQVIGGLLNLLIFLLSGLIIGAIARLLVKGTGSMGLIRTLAAGVLGSFGGALIANMLGLGGGLEFAAAVGVAALLVAVLRPQSSPT